MVTRSKTITCIGSGLSFKTKKTAFFTIIVVSVGLLIVYILICTIFTNSVNIQPLESHKVNIPNGNNNKTPSSSKSKSTSKMTTNTQLDPKWHFQVANSIKSLKLTNSISNISQYIVNLCKNKYFDYSSYNLLYNDKLSLLQRHHQVEWELTHLPLIDDNLRNTTTGKKLQYLRNKEAFTSKNILANLNLTEQLILKPYTNQDELDKILNSLSMRAYFAYDLKKRYMYCPIDKIGSSKLKSLMIYFSSKIKNLKSPHSGIIQATEQIRNREQFYGLIINETDTLESNLKLTDVNDKLYYYLTKFVVIRDPLKRLLSGFIDKCLSNITTFDFCNGLYYDPNAYKFLNVYNINNKNFTFFNADGRTETTNTRGGKTRLEEDNNKIFDDGMMLNGSDSYSERTRGYNSVVMFEEWVNILYNEFVIYKRDYFINEHFRSQIYSCQLFDLINFFDFIVVYDKYKLSHSVEYILKHIVENNNRKENGDLEYGVSIEYVQKHFTHVWGKYENESLFIQPRHRKTTTSDQEMSLLRKYYTKDLALKALYMFQMDYQMLPLEPPMWILDL